MGGGEASEGGGVPPANQRRNQIKVQEKYNAIVLGARDAGGLEASLSNPRYALSLWD